MQQSGKVRAFSGQMVLVLAALGWLLGGVLPGDIRADQAYDVGSGVWSAIESDYVAGKISLDERVQLQIQALTKTPSLPEAYRSKGGIIRCATPMLLEMITEEDKLSPETRKLLDEFLARPVRQKSYLSPYGLFLLHYDTLSTHAVTFTDADSSGVPDLVEKCAAYLDTTRFKHVEKGFLLPPSDGVQGGDSLYDVYFSDISSYGYMIPEGEGPEPWNDAPSYLVLHHTFLGFPPNDDPQGNVAGTAKAVCSHEFHHAVQMAYDRDETLWFVEMDAVHMEEVIFPQVNDNFVYLPEFFNNPGRSLTTTTSQHLYSVFPFGLYIEKRHDSTLFRRAWEGALYGGKVFEALADTLFAQTGWTMDSALAEFWLWNYFTGARDDGQHYDDALIYQQIVISAGHSVLPVDTIVASCSPQGYAACYVKFVRPSGTDGTLRLEFDGTDSVQWAVWIVGTSGGNNHTVWRMPLETGNVGEFDVVEFEQFQSAAMIAVNLSEYSAGASFSYGAHILSGYEISLDELTPDSAVYRSNTRDWKIRVNNPTYRNTIFTFGYYDDAGWVVPDTISVAVPHDSSTVVTIHVEPPPALEPGTNSYLHVHAVHPSDPYVYDELSSRLEVVLLYGDLDLTGVLSLGDLTELINHLFISLDPITPYPEVGNYDCSPDGVTSLGDLTALIDYLFIHLDSKSPCNPY